MRSIFNILSCLTVSLVILFLVGCAHDTPPTIARSSLHADIDTSISDARRTQQSAASQVATIVKSVNDPVAKKAIEDLQQTISDLGLTLETATGKIEWYESQFDLVVSQRDWWQHEDAKDKAARSQSERERDALIWIFSVGCGVTAVTAFKPILETINGWKQLLFIAATFIGGFALGFSIGRWCLHFLAFFTPHLPF